MNSNWEYLLQFQSSELVKRRFEEKHSYSLSTRKALSINASVKQAQEYFHSAKGATMTVRPLLLYYGVLSLSKGLTLFSSKDISESSLKPSHGLGVLNWQKTLKNGWVDVGDLNIVKKQGAFDALLKVTNNISYLKSNCSAVNFKTEFPVPENEFKFSFEDLCRSIPDIKDEYQV